MKVYKAEILFIDYDGIGEEGLRDLIQNTRYANHIIPPSVMGVEEVDVNPWDETNPLNNTILCKAEFDRLFPNLVAEKYSDMLRELCSFLSVGGYNSEGLMPIEVADAKIRDGIQMLLEGQRNLVKRLPQETPVEAWMYPTILSFKDAEATSCPEEPRADLEGQVAWGVDLFADVDSVTDKFGVTHTSYPLGRIREKP